MVGKYSEDLKKEVLNKYTLGSTIKNISLEYGIPKSTIRNWIRKSSIEVENQESITLQLESDNEKKPRNKKEPSELIPKSTNASASAFGWEFQIVSAILLSLYNMEDLSNIIVEGNTEDIELRFENKDPIYAQAKAVQNTPIVENDSGKLNAAFDTLINTSNISKGKYSKLIIIVNLKNPLILKEDDLLAFWKPSMDQLFMKPYNSLPKSGRKYLDERLNGGIRSLKNNDHLSSVKYFDTNKLEIDVNLFSSNDNETTRYSVLRSILNEFIISKCNLDSSYKSKIVNIEDALVKKYFHLAGTKKDGKKKGYELSKKQLVWRIISCLFNEPSDKFIDKIPIDIDNEISEYKSYALTEESEDIDNINRILSGLIDFQNNNKYSNLTYNEIIDKFIEEKFQKYTDMFPENDDKDVINWGTKYIMMKILTNKRMIKKVKKGAGIK